MINESENIEFAGEWEEVVRKTSFTAAQVNPNCKCGSVINNETESNTKGTNDMTESTQQGNAEQSDTLQEFLKTNNITQEQLVNIIDAQSRARSELIDKVATQTGIEANELELLTDHMLQKLDEKTSTIVSSVEGTQQAIPGQSAAVINFSGRGMPTQQSKEQSVPERPSVLRTVANRPNAEQLSGNRTA